MDLVREYAGDNSQAAFAELVRRHINLVYSVALRYTRNETDAQDIAQAVFIMLAQKAAKLRPATVLTGWLYESTRYISMNLLRTRARQQAREQEAYMQSTLDEAPPDAWKQLEPMLEEAMTRLSEGDRALLALRYFQNRTGAEAAAAVGIEEWAARKRIERAVEKLRKFFARRGIVFSAAAVAGAISANSVHAAPAALAQAVTAAAFVKGAAAGSSTLTLIQGALKIMAWSKAKTAVITGVAILLTAGVATVGIKTIRAHRTQPDIHGAWEGAIPTTVGQLRVVLHINGANNAYSASIDSIDQRSKDIPVSKFEYDSPTLKFTSEPVQGTFEGKFNPATDQLTGTWKQPTLDTKIQLKRTATPTPIPAPLTEQDYTPRAGSDLQGLWKGTLQLGPTTLHLAFKFSETESGKFISEMDSPDQGSKGVVVSATTYEKPAVHVEVGSIGGIYDATLNSAHTAITGTWTQMGAEIPLTLERADLNAERAQATARSAGKDFSHTGPDDLTGHWKGALDVQGMKLHLALHVAKLADGNLASTLDSIDQGANDIPANQIEFTAPNVHIEWSTIAGTYDGKIKNGKISGKWQQAGQTFNLVFARAGD
jgi:RNA polymerase sigma factor (sigma-70 family)